MFVTGLLLGADSAPHLSAPWQLLDYRGGTLLGAALDGAEQRAAAIVQQLPGRTEMRRAVGTQQEPRDEHRRVNSPLGTA